MVAFATVLSSCATTEDAGRQSTSTTLIAQTATTSQVTTTSAAPTTTTTPSTPVPTDAVAVVVGEPEILDIPPGYFLQSLVVGERVVVFGSDSKGLGGSFWALDEPIESAVNIYDLAPQEISPGDINRMVYFDRSYYAFPIWADAEDPQLPTMYVSVDGTQWRKTNFGTVTSGASFRFTPDEPATLGGAGVATAIVAKGKIEATGWVSEGGRTVPVMWVGDGSDWVRTYLPTVEGATQGGSLASSELGRMVTLDGGSYYGFGTYVQVAGQDWQAIKHSLGDDGAEAFTRFVGASDSRFYHVEYTHENEPRLTQSVDGLTWESVDLLSDEMESAGLHVTADDRVTLYDQRWLSEDDEVSTIWSLTPNGWVPTELLGTRIISVSNDHIVTAGDSQVFVYERSD